MTSTHISSTAEVWPQDTALATETAGIPLRFATTNPGKITEIAQFLGVSAATLEGIKVELPELHPNNAMFELMRAGEYEACTSKIAAQKAIDAYKITGRDVTVEDSGLYLEGLKGLPGPCIKDWCSPEGLQALCDAVRNGIARATFVVAFAYYNGAGEPQIRSAAVKGSIGYGPKGKNGFGFDAIFVPDFQRQAELWPGTESRTYAEMSAEEKQKISPRVMALQRMADEPFTVPPVIPSIRLPAAALRVVTSDFKNPAPAGHANIVENACLAHVTHRIDRIREEIADAGARRRLVWEGELPERVLDNDVPRVLERMGRFDWQRLHIFDPQSAAEILANGVMRMELINHPLRLEAQLRLERVGYVPVREKRVPVMDRLLAAHEATTFDDFKLGYDGATSDRTTIERIIGVMVQGLWTYSTTKSVTGYTVGSSVPAMNSGFAMAEGAICGNQMFAPVDSYWAEPEAQNAMLQSALAYVDSHPFFTIGRFNHVVLSNGKTVAQTVRERAHRLIGATLKAREDQIAERTEELLELGIVSFRPYEAGVTRTLQASIAQMTRSHRGADMVVWGGQVGSVRQAKECVDAGAHAVIVGIGDGDLCTTADVAAVAADNPGLAYSIVKANIGVPVCADGGVGSRAPVAAALGIASRMRAGALSGGTISLRLVKVTAPDSNGTMYDPTAGEASALTKLRGGQLDALEEPMNVEGTAAREPMDSNSPHIARRIWDGDLAGFAKAIRFSGRDNLVDLIHAAEPDVRMLTPNAIRRGSSHPGTRELHDLPRVFEPRFEPLIPRKI